MADIFKDIHQPLVNAIVPDSLGGDRHGIAEGSRWVCSEESEHNSRAVHNDITSDTMTARMLVDRAQSGTEVGSTDYHRMQSVALLHHSLEEIW